MRRGPGGRDHVRRGRELFVQTPGPKAGEAETVKLRDVPSCWHGRMPATIATSDVAGVLERCTRAGSRSSTASASRSLALQQDEEERAREPVRVHRALRIPLTFVAYRLADPLRHAETRGRTPMPRIDSLCVDVRHDRRVPSHLGRRVRRGGGKGSSRSFQIPERAHRPAAGRPQRPQRDDRVQKIRAPSRAKDPDDLQPHARVARGISASRAWMIPRPTGRGRLRDRRPGKERGERHRRGGRGGRGPYRHRRARALHPARRGRGRGAPLRKAIRTEYPARRRLSRTLRPEIPLPGLIDA